MRESPNSKELVYNTALAVGTHYYPTSDENWTPLGTATVLAFGIKVATNVTVTIEAANKVLDRGPEAVDITKSFDDMNTGAKLTGSITGAATKLIQCNGISADVFRVKVVVATAPASVEILQRVI